MACRSVQGVRQAGIALQTMGLVVWPPFSNFGAVFLHYFFIPRFVPGARAARSDGTQAAA